MTGFALAAVTLGLGAITVRRQRGFFPSVGSGGLIPHATLEEIHSDELEITDHPVEQGASITDHAFKRPAEVVIRCAFSDSPPIASGILGQVTGAAAALGGSTARKLIGAASTINSLLNGFGPSQINATYAALLGVQNERALMDVYTGKRVYKNMLIKSINVTTDQRSENSLMLTVCCREVLIVSTSVLDLASNPADAARFGSPTESAQTYAVPAPAVTIKALK